MKVRLAAVQPRASFGPDEERNVVDALRWMDEAAGAGADLVMFPEGYPGPTNPANSYDAFGPISERARALGIHVVGGRIEPAEGGGHHVVLRLIDDQGRTAGIYRRTTPRGPYIYHDIPAWEFDYVEADELPVCETRLGRIGLLVCSEVYWPELARTLALKGADIILFPSGGALNELLGTWRTLVAARAIENIVYTAAIQNLYEDREEGVGTIAGPEGVLVQSGEAGMLLADLELDRLEFLRGEDEKVEFPKRYETVPGLLRARRPELFGPLSRGPAETSSG